MAVPCRPILQGIGGSTPIVEVHTTLECTSDNNVPVRVHGAFAAFQDPNATDLSVLGREVPNIFDVIVSKRRQEVLFLIGNHQYPIKPT